MTGSQLVVISGYGSVTEPGLRLATFTPGTGRTGEPGGAGGLEIVAEVAGIANPSYAVVHPRRPWIYTVSEVGEDGTAGGVVAVRLDRAGHRLDVGDQRTSGGALPCHVELDPRGRWLVVSNYGSGSVEVLALDDDGSLGAVTDLQVHSGSGARPDRQEGPHAHSATFTPDGGHVLVNDLGIDQLVVYRFDHDRGKLIREGELHVAPGAGPRHLTFHPGGHLLYVINELASSVTTYGYEGDGRLTPAKHDLSTRAGAGGSSGENTPAAIAFVTANQRVYASNRGDDTIATFDVDGDGMLHPGGVASSGGHWPRDLAVEPGGRWMLVAHQFGGTVTVLPLQAGRPGVGAPAEEVAIAGASCVQFAG